MPITRRACVMLRLCAMAAAHCPAASAEPALIEQFQGLTATDDLDGMAKRGFVRALVVYSKTFYFFDRGRSRGMLAEGLQLFERHLNA